MALFAALSYAVTHSTRGGGNAENELQEIEQATLENCNASIQASSMRVEVMNGCTSNELSYELPNGTNVNPNAPIDKSCHIFSPGRGGAAPCGPWLVGCDATQLAALSTIGETCGYIVYAGLFGGNRIYTTIADQTSGVTYGGGGATGAGSLTDGEGNTDTLIGLTGYPAANLCRSLGPEWYLPARDELLLLGTSSDLIGGFATDEIYWSSSEWSAPGAWAVTISTNNDHFYTKYSWSLRVRCIRK